jgi:hypothetical protein
MSVMNTSVYYNLICKWKDNMCHVTVFMFLYATGSGVPGV